MRQVGQLPRSNVLITLRFYVVCISCVIKVFDTNTHTLSSKLGKKCLNKGLTETKWRLIKCWVKKLLKEECLLLAKTLCQIELLKADTSVWFNCRNSQTQSPSLLETVYRLKLKKKTFRKPELLPSSSKETEPSYRNAIPLRASMSIWNSSAPLSAVINTPKHSSQLL